ncbi:MAG: YraN family protein [Bacillota bacterium]
MINNKQLGSDGEDIACKYLFSKGYRVLQRNFTCKIGEIDIVAAERDTLVFIEVKTRTSEKYGKPCEAVSASKQKKIVKTALWYMTQFKMFDYMSRFDVIELLMDDEGKSYIVNHIKDAFQYSGKYGY